MSWRTDKPKGRVFALVLPHDSDCPSVMQYDPPLDLWIDDYKSFNLFDAKWHPLPFHERFGEKTHVMMGRTGS